MTVAIGMLANESLYGAVARYVVCDSWVAMGEALIDSVVFLCMHC